MCEKGEWRVKIWRQREGGAGTLGNERSGEKWKRGRWEEGAVSGECVKKGER